MSESAAPPLPPRPDDRRGQDRFDCDLKSSCKPVEYPRSETPWPAKIGDISAKGIRLILYRRFEPGTLLAIDLKENGVRRLLLARVIRVAKQTKQRWCLGCVLDTQLQTQELQALIESSRTAWIQETAKPDDDEKLSA